MRNYSCFLGLQNIIMYEMSYYFIILRRKEARDRHEADHLNPFSISATFLYSFNFSFVSNEMTQTRVPVAPPSLLVFIYRRKVYRLAFIELHQSAHVVSNKNLIFTFNFQYF